MLLPPKAAAAVAVAAVLLLVSRHQAVEQKALDAMMDYLREYLLLAEDAEPLEGDGPLHEVAAGHAA